MYYNVKVYKAMNYLQIKSNKSNKNDNVYSSINSIKISLEENCNPRTYLKFFLI